MDIYGRVLTTFVDVNTPVYLSLDNEDRLMIADCYNNRFLLLNTQLELLQVLVESNAEIDLSKPKQLCYNEVTSELYVLHSSGSNKRKTAWSDTITVINLR